VFFPDEVDFELIHLSDAGVLEVKVLKERLVADVAVIDIFEWLDPLLFLKLSQSIEVYLPC